MTDQVTFETETANLKPMGGERWLARLENLLKILYGDDFTLDADQTSAGYSLDFCVAMHNRGVSVQDASDEIIKTIEQRKAGLRILDIPELGPTEVNIGDRIKFKSATRDGCKAVWRKVNGFWTHGDYVGSPTVTFNGWSNFMVHPWEIIEHTASA